MRFLTLEAGRVILVVLLLTSRADSCRGESPSTWPAFRGGSHQGVGEGTGYPSNWNVGSGDNILWKTEIPGRGHSSPVISDGRLFVTTAYYADHEGRAATLSRYGMWLCVFTLSLALGWWSASDEVVISRSRSAGTWAFCSKSVLVAMALAGFMIMFVGASVFDYDRCAVRAWLGSSLSTGLLLVTSLCFSRGYPLIRAGLGIIYLAFTIFSIAFVPAQSHVFRSGVLGEQALVLYTTWIVPLFGAAIWYYAEGATLSGQERYVRLRWRLLSMILAGLTVACVTLPPVMAPHVEHLEGNLPGGDFFPARAIAVATASAFAILFLGGVVIVRGIIKGAGSSPQDAPTGDKMSDSPTAWRREDSDIRNSDAASRSARHGQSEIAIRNTAARNWKTRSTLFFAAVLAAAAILGTLALTANFIIRGSGFLQYHLHPPNWSNVTGWSELLLVSITPFFLGGTLSLAFLKTSRTDSLITAGSLAATAATLGLLQMYVNNASPGRDFVRAVMAINQDSGETEWKWEGLIAEKDVVHTMNSHATPTPVVYDNVVVAWFGTAGLVGLDASTGRMIWKRSDLPFESYYGVGGSLAVDEGNVLIASDAAKTARWYLVDARTGTTVKEHNRDGSIPLRGDVAGFSRTPQILRVAGKWIGIIWAWDELTGVDLRTGELCFSHKAKCGGDQVASVAADASNVYLGNPREIVAFPIDALLNLECSPKWKSPANVNCVTPVSNGHLLFSISDYGVMTCLDTSNGKRLWRTRLAGEFRSSPVIAEHRLYAANTDGVIYVGQVSDAVPLWTQICMPEPISATIVPVDSGLYIRTESAVYCIRDTQKTANRSNNPDNL